VPFGPSLANAVPANTIPTPKPIVLSGIIVVPPTGDDTDGVRYKFQFAGIGYAGPFEGLR
jgi:hypothetical protein